MNDIIKTEIWYYNQFNDYAYTDDGKVKFTYDGQTIIMPSPAYEILQSSEIRNGTKTQKANSIRTN